VIGLWTAVATGTMTRPKGYGFVEEEDWSPPSRAGQRISPATEFGKTCDPEVTAILSYDLAGLVDETTSVAGEHPPGGFCV
jgi:hypothetical protein